jgi:GTP-dependent phosphoenolpyruvate carboxykinase
MRIDADAWDAELEQHADWFASMGGNVPRQLTLKRELLGLRLGRD